MSVLLLVASDDASITAALRARCVAQHMRQHVVLEQHVEEEEQTQQVQEQKRFRPPNAFAVERIHKGHACCRDMYAS